MHSFYNVCGTQYMRARSSAFLARSSCKMDPISLSMSVRLSSCNNSRIAERTIMKFDIGEFYWIQWYIHIFVTIYDQQRTLCTKTGIQTRKQKNRTLENKNLNPKQMKQMSRTNPHQRNSFNFGFICLLFYFLFFCSTVFLFLSVISSEIR
jgi:hypothetical protein